MALPYDIHEWPLDSEAGLEGLSRALAADGRQGRDLADEVQRVLRRRQKNPRRWARVVGLRRGPELVFATAGLESAGRAALVFLPDDINEEWGELAAECLARLAKDAGKHEVVLLEGLVDPGNVSAPKALLAARFRRLTSLHYHSRWIDRPVPASASADAVLIWEVYEDHKRPLFHAALDASYLDSQDCPELCGLRPTHDVLEGHRDAGCFEPGRWWVARWGDAPAGVILVNPLESAPASEVVYLGVNKEFRRRGVAHAMLRRALLQARASGDTIMTLAVDERNARALHFYRRWGFEESLRRTAWIATPLHE